MVNLSSRKRPIDARIDGRQVAFVRNRLEQKRPQVDGTGTKRPKSVGSDPGDKAALASPPHGVLGGIGKLGPHHHGDVVAPYRVASLENVRTVVVEQGAVVDDGLHAASTAHRLRTSKSADGHQV